MSTDFQVVFPAAAIELSRVRQIPLPAGMPRALEVIGKDFRSVDEVLINQIASPDVIITSKTRLIAQVPEQVLVDTLTSISVISRQLTVSSKSFIRFRVSKTPGKVRGILRLLQLFLKILLTTPGTDIFSPRTGGAALKNLGQSFGQDEGGDIVSDFIISVDRTSRQIVAVQGRDASIPRDERLLSAKVLKAGFDKSQGALVVAVEVLSQAGRSAVANVEL